MTGLGSEFYTWLDQGNKEHEEVMVDTDEHETNTHTDGVTPGEGILESDTPWRNDVTTTDSQDKKMVDTGTLERHTHLTVGLSSKGTWKR